MNTPVLPLSAVFSSEESLEKLLDQDTRTFVTKYTREIGEIADFLNIYRSSNLGGLDEEDFDEFSRELARATESLAACYKNYYLAKKVFAEKKHNNIFFELFQEIFNFSLRAKRIASHRKDKKIFLRHSRAEEKMMYVIRFNTAQAYFCQARKLTGRHNLDSSVLWKARKYFSKTISLLEKLTNPGFKAKPQVHRFLATAYYFKSQTSDLNQIPYQIKAIEHFRKSRVWYEKQKKAMPRSGYFLGKKIYESLTELVLKEEFGKSIHNFLRKKIFNQPVLGSLEKERNKLAIDCCKEAIKINYDALAEGYNQEGDLTNLGHLYLELARVLKGRESARALRSSARYLGHVSRKNPRYNPAKYYLARTALLAGEKGIELGLEETVDSLMHDLASRATLVRDNLSRSFVCTLPDKEIQDEINIKIPRDPENLEAVLFEKTVIEQMHGENKRVMQERGLEKDYITVPRIIYASKNFLVLENIGRKTFYHWLREIFSESGIKDRKLKAALISRDLEKDLERFKERHDLVLELYKQAQEEMIRQKIVLERLYDSGRLEKALADVGINLRKKVRHFETARDYSERFESSLNKVRFEFGRCSFDQGLYLGQDDYGYHFFVRKDQRYTKKHLYLMFRNLIAPKLSAIKEKSIDFDTNPTNFPLELEPSGAIRICGGFDFETLRYRSELFMFSVLVNHEGPGRTFFNGHYKEILRHNLQYTEQERSFGNEKKIPEEALQKALHDDFYVSINRFFTMIGTNENKLRDDLSPEEKECLFNQQSKVYLPNIKSRLKAENDFLSESEKREAMKIYDVVRDLKLVH